MVNAGPNSNHTEFMISLKPMPYFDQKYVAIGQLIDGEEALQAIERVKVVNEKPAQLIEIAKVSELTDA
jgi:cyclophilin family peptidyl-prolyl cis-trans isomerase